VAGPGRFGIGIWQTPAPSLLVFGMLQQLLELHLGLHFVRVDVLVRHLQQRQFVLASEPLWE
jgi:hypothetical protein